MEQPVLSFLSQPWWAGVQGVLAFIGVAAIALAVIDFIVRANSAPPDAVAFRASRSPGVVNGHREVGFEIRPMGPIIMYEPELRIDGVERDLGPLPDVPPVFDARSNPIEVELNPTLEELRSGYLTLVWVTPSRRRSRAAGARIRLDGEGTHQRWIRYRWQLLRKHPGRWVKSREISPRSRHRMIIPE